MSKEQASKEGTHLQLLDRSASRVGKQVATLSMREATLRQPGHYMQAQARYCALRAAALWAHLQPWGSIWRQRAQIIPPLAAGAVLLQLPDEGLAVGALGHGEHAAGGVTAGQGGPALR